MSATVEFYFDVGSPAAYLAFQRLPGICQATGATIAYRPMLLGGVFQATGNQSPVNIPAKGRYIMIDFERFARRHGTPFEHNPHFPINTLALMRAAVGLQMHEPERFLAYLEAVFRAIWVDGKNMNDPGVITDVLHAAGFDPERVLALTADPEVKERLKAVTQEAVARGVFGAPTFFIGKEMYWGQDRLDFVKEALEVQA